MVDNAPATQNQGEGGQQRESIPDKVLMYACIFTYEKASIRSKILHYQVAYNAIQNYETSGQLPQNSTQVIQEFERMGHEQ